MLARLGRLRAGLGAAAAVGASAAALSARQQQQLCACASAPAPPSPAEPAAPDAPPPPSEPGIVDKVLAPAREAYEAASDAVYDTFIKPYAEPSRDKLLPDLPPALAAKPTLVVALDGLLIESVYTRQHGWRYVKRPGLDAFLDQLFPFYEIVLWTECLVNADPVVDKFDPRRRIRHRLYRDTTTYRNGHHYKDLEVLNRDLRKVLILDTDDESYAMQPSHGITVLADTSRTRRGHVADTSQTRPALATASLSTTSLAAADLPAASLPRRPRRHRRHRHEREPRRPTAEGGGWGEGLFAYRLAARHAAAG